MDKIKKYLSGNFPLIAGMFVLIIVILGILLAMALRSSNEIQSLLALNQQVDSMNDSELQTEKARQELVQLQLENEKTSDLWSILPSYATLLTAIVAVIGVFVTIWKQISENKRQRELDARQRQLDREQRETESKRQMDLKFTSIIENLGSESQSIQIIAAVSLLTFLRPEYKDYHDQVYLILLANLKTDHSPEFNKSLVESFEKAVRVKIQTAQEDGKQVHLNLSNANLYRINLSGLDLSNADLGFADLRLANLIGANLFRARGIKANLERAKLSRTNMEEARFRKARFSYSNIHDARLISTRLEEADLRDVQFFRSELQSAHLENAELRGARFEEANLNDTYFNGAKLDNEITLRGITRAYNWKKAHFDQSVQAKLAELT